jgi:Ca2+-binding RTX toxin-like protein
VGDDRLDGGDGDNYIDGGEGDDIMDAEIGADVLIGGPGRDIIEAGGGNDQVFGGDEADVINGEDGADTIYGADGEDLIYGGAGADILNGGEHWDRLVGDSGPDRLWGGGDVDWFVFKSAGALDGGDSVEDFQDGADRIVIEKLGVTRYQAGGANGTVFAHDDASGAVVLDVVTSTGAGFAIEIADPNDVLLAAQFSAADFLFA